MALLAFAFGLGCASAPDRTAPGVASSTLYGYVCDRHPQCRTDQRCYRRFPSSTGRCVRIDYYEANARRCYSDGDCEMAEKCFGAEVDKAGECARRFREPGAATDSTP